MYSMLRLVQCGLIYSNITAIVDCILCGIAFVGYQSIAICWGWIRNQFKCLNSCVGNLFPRVTSTKKWESQRERSKTQLCGVPARGTTLRTPRKDQSNPAFVTPDMARNNQVENIVNRNNNNNTYPSSNQFDVLAGDSSTVNSNSRNHDNGDATRTPSQPWAPQPMSHASSHLRPSKAKWKPLSLVSPRLAANQPTQT